MSIETNNRVNKLKRRLKICNATGKCSVCPFHGGENQKRNKHGPKKPRYKDKK